MAFNITTNYCGEDSMAIIGKALLGGDTLAAQCLTVYPNVKNATTIHKLSTDGLLQADSCDFTASGDVDLVDKKVTPADYKVNIELCITDLEAHWLSAQMAPGALNDEIPTEAGEFILDYVAQRVAQTVDNLIWMASVAGGDEFDGLYKQGFDDATVIDVPFVAITPANVIAQLQAMYDAIPDEICDAPDMKLMVAKNVAKAYKQATAAASAEMYFVGERPLDFLGLPIVPIRGMAASHMFAAQVSNLVMATDLLTDFNTTEVIDMSKTTGADTARIKMRMKFAPCFVWGAQVVIYQNTFV